MSQQLAHTGMRNLYNTLYNTWRENIRLGDLDVDDSQEIQQVLKVFIKARNLKLPILSLTYHLYILILSFHLVLDTDVVF